MPYCQQRLQRWRGSRARWRSSGGAAGFRGARDRRRARGAARPAPRRRRRPAAPPPRRPVAPPPPTLPPSAPPPPRSLKYRAFKSQAHLQQLDGELTEARRKELSRQVDDLIVASEAREGAAAAAAGAAHGGAPPPTAAADILDISATLNDAAAAIVDDSFLRCFKSAPDAPWNWNFYLLPLWAAGALLRNLVLFPLRVLTLLTSFLLFFVGFAAVGLALRPGPRRAAAERALIQALGKGFVASWTGVIRYHGPRPVPAPGRVWVANHTSMIDYVVLCAHTPFAAIMQLHPGWVGVMQKRYLSALGCLWFDRAAARDRATVAERMRAHVAAPGAAPLLIFPEGTCVNNEHVVMFKRGAFDLGAVVCPVAIKYNKIFVDAFWNSKRQSFSQHLGKIMRSWALVADVWFLEPQARREGESAAAFAERVQRLIADRARLRVAPWDGYLKYYNLAERRPELVERQRHVYAERVRKWAGGAGATAAAAEAEVAAEVAEAQAPPAGGE